MIANNFEKKSIILKKSQLNVIKIVYTYEYHLYIAWYISVHKRLM